MRLLILIIVIVLGLDVFGAWWVGGQLLTQIESSMTLREPAVLVPVPEPWPRIVRALGWVRPRRAADLLGNWGDRAVRAGSLETATSLYRSSLRIWPTNQHWSSLLTLDWNRESIEFDADLISAERHPPFWILGALPLDEVWLARQAAWHGDAARIVTLLRDRNDPTSLRLRSVAALALLEPGAAVPALPDESFEKSLRALPGIDHPIAREQIIVQTLIDEHMPSLALQRADVLRTSISQDDRDTELLIADAAMHLREWTRMHEAALAATKLDPFSYLAWERVAMADQRLIEQHLETGDTANESKSAADRADWLWKVAQIQ